MSRNGHGGISRREALGVMGGMVLAAGARLSLAADQPAAQKGLALQLYTLREPAKQDLPGTLKKVREMGWEHVQWSGMPDLPAEKIREALDAAGLKAVAAHCGVEPFETDFENQVKFWKTVGVSHLGPGGMMGDCKDSLEAWLKGAQRLDALGAKLRAEGIHLTYHNHDGEFEKFPGDDRCKLDILYESTSPENLRAEIDTAWVYVAGADPAAYLRKCKGRCQVIHVKDAAGKKRLGRVQFTPVGQGALNWKDIFAAAHESGTEWYVYEQDNSKGDIFEAALASYEFMKKNVTL